eukprot:765713-Hanusia_phi.AAC.3
MQRSDPRNLRVTWRPDDGKQRGVPETVDLSIASFVKFHTECMDADIPKFDARQRGRTAQTSVPFSSLATTDPHFKAIVNAIQQDDTIVLRRSTYSVIFSGRRHVDLVDRLLRLESGPQSNFYRRQIDLYDEAGRTPLHFACALGNQNAVEVLLDANANLSAISAEGKTPLIHAVERGHTKLVSELLTRLAFGKIGPDSQVLHSRGYVEQDRSAAVLSGRSYNHPHMIGDYQDESGFGFTNDYGASLPRKSIQKAPFGPRELPQSLYPMWMPGNRGVLGAGEEMRIPSRISWSKSTNELIGIRQPQSTESVPYWQTRAGHVTSGDSASQMNVENETNRDHCGIKSTDNHFSINSRLQEAPQMPVSQTYNDQALVDEILRQVGTDNKVPVNETTPGTSQDGNAL